MLKSRESFDRIFSEQHIMVPDELADYDHLVVNTSEGTPAECAGKIIDYISLNKL